MTDRQNRQDEEGGVATLAKPKVKQPSMYQVVMLNDDYTTMDFVIHVLQKFFHKTFDQANRIMLNIHQKGKDVCGLYPYDVAATKIMQVNDYSRKNEMPLKCIMEKNS